MLDDNERFMQYAIREAQRAWDQGEIPIGCVIVHKGEVIGKAHNQRELLQDPTAHAEMVAITQAASHFKSWRLEDCKLYVTLEPCPMCAGAIIMARVSEVYFGASDPKAGACGSLLNLLEDSRFNHQPKVIESLLAEECGAMLSSFFKQIRNGAQAKPSGPKVPQPGSPEDSAY